MILNAVYRGKTEEEGAYIGVVPTTQIGIGLN